MSNPWQAPTPGQATIVGHANQFLIGHPTTVSYAGVAAITAPTIGVAADQLGGGMLAHEFANAGSAYTLTYITLPIGALGAGADCLVTVQSVLGGVPNGIISGACLIPAEWLPSGLQSSQSSFAVPLNALINASTSYFIVIQPGAGLLTSLAGTAQQLQLAGGINDVEVTRATGSYGTAMTYNPSTSAWTSQSYGYAIEFFNTVATGQMVALADDPINVSNTSPSNLTSTIALPSKESSYSYSGAYINNAYAWSARSFGQSQNLLCRDDASLEVSIGTWVASTNCTIAKSNTIQALDGSYSLRMASAAAGDMKAVTSTGGVFPAQYYSVVAGNPYTASAQFNGSGATRNVYCGITWYNASGSVISSSSGTPIAEAGTGWTATSVTATAPALAVFALVFVYVVGTGAASEAHYVDEIGLYTGSAAVWSYPGVGVASHRALTYSGTTYSGTALTGASLLTSAA